MKNFLNMGTRRMLGMLTGNILLGIGVSVFKLSGMGNDPYSAMCMAVSELLGLPYSTFLLLLNACVFILEATLGRKYIGLGTMINWFLVGYVAEFFIWLTDLYIADPMFLSLRITYVLLGVIIMSLGVSLYQTSNAGIAPFDSVSIIMAERLPIPYFWCRMMCDGLCAIICLLAGGLIGLGTFVCAFGLGPVIHFFNIKVSKKLLYKAEAF